MQTTLTDQIKAIQVLRKFISENVGMIEGMSATDLDRTLNDADATITALKMSASNYNKSVTEDRREEISINFFKNLPYENI